MERIITIRNTSLIFFVITGILHLSASVLLANNTLENIAFILYKVMDIPFIITGAIYGLSSARLKLTDPTKNHKKLETAFLALIIILLVALLIINLFVPDLN